MQLRGSSTSEALLKEFCHSSHCYLACNVSEASEEVWGGVVVSAFSLDWFNYNPSHRLSLLPPFHDQILHLETKKKVKQLLHYIKVCKTR